MRKIAIATLAIGVTIAYCVPAGAVQHCTRLSCTAPTVCRDAVNNKGLKGAAWQVQYDKCRADPSNYK
jgi:putative ubiquitin-RnfH superfamily antitoxin RatB of RatAB toxin-antitoxin module